ncbi:ribosomal protein L11 [Corchorus olitorius]|uniref:Ribosomal protein L11 n=1 Tax=Corchorus olitorius TaxID=93759 RepID=A0A1R3H6Q1_9ROSI|nr:ribosomal protein L11 [Corchorus olitorius]
MEGVGKKDLTLLIWWEYDFKKRVLLLLAKIEAKGVSLSDFEVVSSDFAKIGCYLIRASEFLGLLSRYSHITGAAFEDALTVGLKVDFARHHLKQQLAVWESELASEFQQKCISIQK